MDWRLPWHEVCISGRDALKGLWDSGNANSGLTCVYDIGGALPTILHCYQTTGGPNGFWIGNLMGANGLDERNKNFGIFADFCRLKGLPSWEMVATADDLWCSMRVDQQLWGSHWDDFINFCRR